MGRKIVRLVAALAGMAALVLGTVLAYQALDQPAAEQAVAQRIR